MSFLKKGSKSYPTSVVPRYNYLVDWDWCKYITQWHEKGIIPLHNVCFPHWPNCDDLQELKGCCEICDIYLTNQHIDNNRRQQMIVCVCKADDKSFMTADRIVNDHLKELQHVVDSLYAKVHSKMTIWMQNSSLIRNAVRGCFTTFLCSGHGMNRDCVPTLEVLIMETIGQMLPNYPIITGKIPTKKEKAHYFVSFMNMIFKKILFDAERVTLFRRRTLMRIASQFIFTIREKQESEFEIHVNTMNMKKDEIANGIMATGRSVQFKDNSNMLIVSLNEEDRIVKAMDESSFSNYIRDIIMDKVVVYASVQEDAMDKID